MKSIYEFQNYREYLLNRLEDQGRRSGQKTAFAKAIGCQTSFLSQVLSEQVDLSLEQAHRANKFFHHDKPSSDYFMNMVQYSRAGDMELKKYFQEKMNDLSHQQFNIKNRVETNRDITEEIRGKYFSSWIYTAVHIAASLRGQKSVNSLAQSLRLDPDLVLKVVEFLTEQGLINYDGAHITMGQTHIHLPSDSEIVKNLHTNWRLKAIENLDHKRKSDLHYSVNYTISEKDANRIRENILKLIEDNMTIVKPSPEDVIYCQTIDFFKIC